MDVFVGVVSVLYWFWTVPEGMETDRAVLPHGRLLEPSLLSYNVPMGSCSFRREGCCRLILNAAANVFQGGAAVEGPSSWSFAP